MAFVSQPLVVRIFINSTINGWAERWPIQATNWAEGLAVAYTLVQARRRILSSNARIEWACLGRVMPPYWEQVVITAPLLPLPQWGPAGFDMQGLLFDFNTGTGHWSQHLFRAIDGTEIYDKAWKRDPFIVPAIPPALPLVLATASKQLLFENTFSTFFNLVATGERKPPEPDPPVTWWVEPYELMTFNAVSSRMVGRLWSRMSWEPEVYADRPNFTPCGMAVTVQRQSYRCPCDFGQGYPPTPIHYYFAKPGAAVFTDPTIFYGWNRSKENVYHDGPGETRRPYRSEWTNGFAYGDAPAITYDGYLAQFLGYGPPNYGGGPDRPAPPLPTCDEPGVGGLTADDGATFLTADDATTILQPV